MGLSSEKRELLSHEETMEFIREAQDGSKKAKDILISHNIGLIKSVLRGFSNRGYENEDLFQIGSIGLLKAINKFDMSYGVKFSTYAVPMIVGEIKRFLRDDGLIKVSRSLKQVAAHAKATEERLSKELGREPSIQEIADDIGIDKEDIVMAFEASYHPKYLYDVVHQSDGAPIYLIDKLNNQADEKDVDLVDSIMLKGILNELKSRDRQVIILRYFKDQTQTQVADVLGISQVQVSRIEKKIIEEMRRKFKKA